MEGMKLGTPEAALKSCVNLISRLFNVPEDSAEDYLDLYYQLRVRCELENTPERVKTKKKRPAPETTPPEPPLVAPAGFEPVEIKASPAAQAAADKRRIRDRLLRLRQAGLTSPVLLKAAEGCIKEESIVDIINAKPVAIGVYRLLDAVLDSIEKQSKPE